VPRKPAQPNVPAAVPSNEIVVYENGSDVRLEVRTDGETVWLTPFSNQEFSSRFCRAALPRDTTDARPTRRAVTRGAFGLAKSRVQQLTTPPPDPPRRKIGFTQAKR
jgi:hypothetical protein